MLWLLLACSGAPDAPTATTPPPPAASAAPVWANVAPARVLEAVHGDGRSYLQIEEASYTFWVSVPKLDVAAGDYVKLGLGSLHQKLHSTELTRDFENITEIADAAKTEPPTPAETISPPEGGVSIAELYAKKAELSGKPVTVRGRVVKVSKGIFDKNWYHLRDGTGDEGTNDLTVTTLAEAELGDVVVATAPLTTDRDLGFGYVYSIILEDAAVSADGAAPATAPAAPAPVAPPAAEAPAPAAPMALVPLVPRPRQAGLPPAPSRERLSLEVGAATPEQVDALVRSRALTCTTAPSPRRTTIHTVCDGTIPTTAIESGTIQGVVQEIRFSRTDTGPIHSIHTSVRYSLSARAAEDYKARSAQLVAALGKPAIERPFDASRLENKLVRYAAEWSFDNLDVSVSLFRTGTDYYTLSESWSVPGIEAGAFERAASGGHGAGPARPAGWNPHVRP
jgi:hypothetical protein